MTEKAAENVPRRGYNFYSQSEATPDNEKQSRLVNASVYGRDRLLACRSLFLGLMTELFESCRNPSARCNGRDSLKIIPFAQSINTTGIMRRLNNIGRSSLTPFRLLRFLVIVRKSICLRRCSNMKYWESSLTSFTLPARRGAIAALSRRWIVDAHREGRRYIVHSDELLSAFLEIGSDVAVI